MTLVEFIMESDFACTESVLVCADICEEHGCVGLATCFRRFAPTADDPKSKQMESCQWAWRNILKNSTLEIVEAMAKAAFCDNWKNWETSQAIYLKYLRQHRTSPLKGTK